MVKCYGNKQSTEGNSLRRCFVAMLSLSLASYSEMEKDTNGNSMLAIEIVTCENVALNRTLVRT